MALSSSEASRQAWLRHASQLSAEELQMFKSNSRGDVLGRLTDLEDSHRDGQKQSHMSRLVRKAEPLLRVITLYMPVVATASQADPYPSSLVIGGIMSILQAGNNFIAQENEVSDVLVSMSRRAEILLKAETEIFASDAEVVAALVEVFCDILDFCRGVYRLWFDKKGHARGGLRRVAKAFIHNFQSQFGDVVARYEKDVLYANEKMIHCERRRNQKFQLDVPAKLEQMSLDNKSHDVNIRQTTTMVQSLGLSLSGMHQENRLLNDRTRIQNELDRTFQRLEKWLEHFPTFESTLAEKIKDCLEGTTLWLRSDRRYQDWWTSSSGSLLRVTGKPGCGKSVLAAATISKMQENEASHLGIAYVFCSHQTDDPRALMGSIVAQLAKQSPEPDQTLEDEFRRSAARQPGGPTWAQIVRIMATITGKFSKTAIIFDGLDETSAVTQEVIATQLYTTTSSTSSTYILVFSRPGYASLDAALKECDQIPVELDDSRMDIEAFIDERFIRQHTFAAIDPRQLRAVKERLVISSEGSFLWLSLLVQPFSDALTLNELWESLDELPRGLHGVFINSLQRIENRTTQRGRATVLDALFWITNTKFILRKEQLLEILAFTPPRRSSDQKDKIMIDAKFLPAKCADLVVLDHEENFQLVHSSLRDFLHGLTSDCSGIQHEYFVRQNSAAKLMSEACLTYLLLGDFANGPVETWADMQMLEQSFPFLHYAATKWIEHAEDAQGQLDHDLVMSLARSQPRRELCMQIMLSLNPNAKVFPYTGGTTSLHFLAMTGLVDIAKSMEECRSAKYTEDKAGMFPLDYAAIYTTNKEMCAWLLDDFEQIMPLSTLYDMAWTAAREDWPEILDRLLRKGFDAVDYRSGHLGTILHVAAFQGSEKVVKRLLEIITDFDIQDVDGSTALLLAAESNHITIIELLLEAGADPRVCDKSGSSPLHWICAHDNIAVVRKILRSSSCRDMVLAKDCDGISPIHCAAKANADEIIRLLCEYQADLDDETEDKRTPLQWAACNNGLEAARLLIELGAQLNHQDRSGATALHIALDAGHDEFADMLICARAMIDIIDTLNGFSPLHLAAKNGDLVSVAKLLEHEADLSIQDQEGLTALHWAVREGFAEVAELLLRNGADMNIPMLNDSHILEHAATSGEPKMVPLLLEYGLSLASGEDYGLHALYNAAEQGHFEFVKAIFPILTNNWAEFRTSEGRTCLHAAAADGNAHIVNFFLEHGAKQLLDARGVLPIHFAARSGSLEVVQIFLPTTPIDSLDERGGSLIHYAVASGNAEMVQFLVDAKADLSIQSENGDTPLMLSLLREDFDDISLILLKAGSDPCLGSVMGITCLHAALLISKIQPDVIVHHLLQAGANPMLVGRGLPSPFSIAVNRNMTKIAKMMLDHSYTNDLSHLDHVNNMFLICYFGDLDIFRELVHVSVDCRKQDMMGNTLFHAAAYGGQSTLIRPLLELGLDINMSNSLGLTPLMLAAYHGHEGFVRQALEYGADVNHCNIAWGETALTLATANDFPEIVTELLGFGAEWSYPSLALFRTSARSYRHETPTQCEILTKQASEGLSIRLDDRSLRSIIVEGFQSLLLYYRSEKFLDNKTKKLIRDRILAALSARGQDYDIETAKHFWLEGIFVQDANNPMNDSSCSFCGRFLRPILSREFSDIWVCLQCDDLHLCGNCYNPNLTDGARSQELPQCVQDFNDFESQVRSIRQAALPVTELGLDETEFCFRMLSPVKNWVFDMRKTYEKWEDDAGDVIPVQNAGREFVRLLSVLLTMGTSAEPSSESAIAPNRLDIYENLGAQLKGLHVDQLRNTKHKTWNCSNHSYILLSEDEQRILSQDKTALDDDRYVKAQWIRDRLRHYEQFSESSVPVTVDAMLHKRQPTWISAKISKHDEGIDRSKMTESADIATVEGSEAARLQDNQTIPQRSITPDNASKSIIPDISFSCSRTGSLSAEELTSRIITVSLELCRIIQPLYKPPSVEELQREVLKQVLNMNSRPRESSNRLTDSSLPTITLTSLEPS